MSHLTIPRVLTVEDNPIVSADLRVVLEDAGFDVLPHARDGEEALELARRHDPDVIVMDLRLPGVDGAETTRRIRSERDVPVVALTGVATGELYDRAVEAGVSARVSKPFSASELIGAVGAALAEDERRTRRTFLPNIERMVREGRSESEISEWVEESRGRRTRRRWFRR